MGSEMPVQASVDLVPDLLPDLVPAAVVTLRPVFGPVHYLLVVVSCLFEQSTDCAL